MNIHFISNVFSKIFRHFLFASLVSIWLGALIVGCTPVVGMGSAVNFSAQTTPLVTFVLAAPDATATPTPFQPLPPTSIAPVAQEVSASPTPFILVTPTSPSPSPQSQPEQTLEQLPSQVNILLLGSDRRPWSSGFRTDTIILLTLNATLERVNITSFPRDLYVTLPGRGMDRINTAWTYGGYELLSKTFEYNFGIKPDYYVLIDFSSFKRIIDSFGGLDVNVGQPLSDYRAGYWVTIPAGMVHMDADLVLWYVRSRKTTNDIARNRRQQEVLQAIFDKLISLNALQKAPEFYDIYKDSVKTNITLFDALKWLPFAMKIAETHNIHQYFITYKHVYDWITPGGAMVLVPNKQALMNLIRKTQNLQ